MNDLGKMTEQQVKNADEMLNKLRKLKNRCRGSGESEKAGLTQKKLIKEGDDRLSEA